MQAIVEIEPARFGTPAKSVLINGDIPAFEICQFHLHGTRFQPTNNPVVYLTDVTRVFDLPEHCNKVRIQLAPVGSRFGPR